MLLYFVWTSKQTKKKRVISLIWFLYQKLFPGFFFMENVLLLRTIIGPKIEYDVSMSPEEVSTLVKKKIFLFYVFQVDTVMFPKGNVEIYIYLYDISNNISFYKIFYATIIEYYDLYGYIVLHVLFIKTFWLFII